MTAPASFVGENFSYRPYFQDAMQGRQARFYALGTTSLKRGYYFSSPVMIDDAISGVIVFKVDIDAIEASWRGGEYEIFVSDPEGIIFMTGKPDWLYASLLPLTPDRLARTAASRRYANADAARTADHAQQLRRRTQLMTIADDGGSREYLVLRETMPDAGWTVNVLIDTALGTRAGAAPPSPPSCCFSPRGLAACDPPAAAGAARRAHGDAAKRADELERRVEERTADLAPSTAARRGDRRAAATEQQLRQTQADLIQAGKLAGAWPDVGGASP